MNSSDRFVVNAALLWLMVERHGSNLIIENKIFLFFSSVKVRGANTFGGANNTAESVAFWQE